MTDWSQALSAHPPAAPAAPVEYRPADTATTTPGGSTAPATPVPPARLEYLPGGTPLGTDGTSRTS